MSDMLAASPGTELAFVVEWDDSEALSAAAGKSNRNDKRAAMRHALATIKAPLLSELKNQASVSVHDIAGSSHAVVTAPAKIWRELIKQPTLRDTDCWLNPNEQFFSD